MHTGTPLPMVLDMPYRQIMAFSEKMGLTERPMFDEDMSEAEIIAKIESIGLERRE